MIDLIFIALTAVGLNVVFIDDSYINYTINIMIFWFWFMANRIRWVEKIEDIQWVKDRVVYDNGPDARFMVWTFWIWDADWYYYPEKRINKNV